tara:strand:- start:9535 stop:10668 length:1134 start_codon:yes stop_codon:yes gene_type:complete
MKIGIITFWESNNNYGQILQLFAMQAALKKMGHEPFLIKYHRIAPKNKQSFVERLINFNPVRSLKHRLDAPLREKSKQMDAKRRFQEFKEKHILFGKEAFKTLDSLKENPPKADVYLTGSDQVWNHTFKVSAEAFLLGFGGADVKRISYAASYGVTEQDEATQKMFKSYLKDFDGISVREKSGVQLTEDLGHKAQWVLDPTLLFTKEDWVDLLELNKVGEQPGVKKEQVFMYMLGNSEIVDKDKFIAFAKALPHKSVIHATANSDFTGNAYPTIPEWVYNISTSELVITTSFHGMIFCILNNTKFIVLPNTGSAKGMNGRVESMLTALGLQEHIMTSFDQEKVEYILGKEINWDKVNEFLAKWRVDSFNFLEKHINS